MANLMTNLFPTEFVQPPGKHNAKHDCVVASSLSHYVKVPFLHLNPVQSDFVKYLEEDDENVIVAAATSSGKTLCAELFAARSLSLGKRVLYVAPLKALADEKYNEWSEEGHTFSSFNVERLTGDDTSGGGISDKKKEELNKADILLLTPEMFDSKVRFFDDHTWLHNTNFVGDEIHLIGSKSRGDKLEMGLINYLGRSPESRCLFLSATIPNVNDFSEWLTNVSGQITRVVKSNYRPCKLDHKFVPFDAIGEYGRPVSYSENERLRLNKVAEMVMTLGDEPILVFVGNKKFGKNLSERLDALGINHEYHSADLNRENRNRIEVAFRKREFNVLVATTTIAWGVNTPARHVILAHTRFGLTPMEPMDVHQAMGRAGRLGYSEKGTAHILVEKHRRDDERKRYFGNYEIESTLNTAGVLIFHIVNQIDSGEVEDVKSLIDWYKKTLAYIQREETLNEEKAIKVLEDLEKFWMIEKDELGKYHSTILGKISSRMYMNPIDVFNWFVNFGNTKSLNPSVDSTQKEIDYINLSVACALGCCYSFGAFARNPVAYLSRDEGYSNTVSNFSKTMSTFSLYRDYSKHLSDGMGKRSAAVKYSAVIFGMLSGHDIDPSLRPTLMMVTNDIDRIIYTIKQADARVGKKMKNVGFGWGVGWDFLNLRLRYGIGPELYELVKLDGIGKAFAKRLYDSGMSTKHDILDPKNRLLLEKVMGKKRSQKLLSQI